MQLTDVIRVYKSAHDKIIEIDVDLSTAMTNLTRNVIDKNYAKYRCSEARVVNIYDKYDENKECHSIPSDYDNKFVYIKGKNVAVTNYDQNDDAICTNGIHFFLTKEAAYYYGNCVCSRCTCSYTGRCKQWNEDGGLEYDRYYICGYSMQMIKKIINNIIFFVIAIAFWFLGGILLLKIFPGTVVAGFFVVYMLIMNWLSGGPLNYCVNVLYHKIYNRFRSDKNQLPKNKMI